MFRYLPPPYWIYTRLLIQNTTSAGFDTYRRFGAFVRMDLHETELIVTV
jgi:hypothetical protein